nr:uncharacterized protein LOC101883276 [Danio rerio]|eukprot:XP_021324920.1 uncharacterized protein LOC101883276 [Danio rerio]
MRLQSPCVSPSPGAVLVLHSLLLEFPLAIAFAEQLLTYNVGETIERSEDELDTVPTSVLIQVVELLVPEEKFLTLEVFHKFTLDRAKQDIRSVWRAILACGYDLHFDRCPSGEFASALCSATVSKQHTGELLLPLMELRLTQTYQNSIGTLLCEAKGSCCAVKVLWCVCTAAWPSSTSLPPRVLTHSHTSSTSLQCVTSHLNICSSCPISC